jgi:hypothetical protein
MSAAPGYFSLRFKFHVDSDSVSDSSWNSVSLRKSFNHSNCIKPADTAKKDIHLHYCALHSVWFLLRFGNAYAQEKSQKIVKVEVKSVFKQTVCLHFELLYFLQHELHLWIYYMSKFLNTSEFIIMINSRQILNLS